VAWDSWSHKSLLLLFGCASIDLLQPPLCFRPHSTFPWHIHHHDFDQADGAQVALRSKHIHLL
jgi:hypothetical protein